MSNGCTWLTFLYQCLFRVGSLAMLQCGVKAQQKTATNEQCELLLGYTTDFVNHDFSVEKNIGSASAYLFGKLTLTPEIIHLQQSVFRLCYLRWWSTSSYRQSDNVTGLRNSFLMLLSQLNKIWLSFLYVFGQLHLMSLKTIHSFPGISTLCYLRWCATSNYRQ